MGRGKWAVIGVTPFGRADAALAAALCRCGALGVIDLTGDPDDARASLAELARLVPEGFGIRVGDGEAFPPESLPESVRVVVVEPGAAVDAYRDQTVLVEATSLEEARHAVADGADAVIAKGCESGGRIGEEAAFILLQQLVEELPVPVYAQGGIGLHTAAAAIAGGAAGVVLDSQLALLREAQTPEDVRAVIANADGSETEVVEGRRVLKRPVDPDRGRIPAGQDIALAAALASQFPSAAALVRAITDGAYQSVRRARTLRPLAEHGPLAREHGIRYPIAQGPMTRVSDVAGFASAVADGGGLPFIAVALLRGPQLRAVLEETAELLGDRAYGVGILGFAPPELREEQLEVVRQIGPPVALIAGGRPEQARPLEDQGIKTYLHVPSPGLLEQFLRKGARRFVFEGRECGGHVGPRTSFTLWQSQIDILLRHPGDDVSVLFAGGIHDGRSAAMVEAMAAPLVEHGAKVGVLAGTAYLFTEEAVARGAILPPFQEAALTCRHTVLLETAPGHETRCADTPFVRAFLAERERLEKEGVSGRELWEQLEQLNLGRLRLAAKGLRREGDELVTADEEEQRREGMVMIGQAAMLRHGKTTVAALHEEISAGAGKALEGVEIPEAPARRRPEPADIAIVGMAGVFPGAHDVASFWSNIVAGRNAIREVSPSRWDPDTYFRPAGDRPEANTDETVPSKWGGFLDPVPFDPVDFGIPPRSVSAVEPIQLLALEVARRALADAGYEERPFDRDRASVIFGAEAGSDLAAHLGFRTMWRKHLGELPEGIAEAFPTMTEDTFPGLLANVIAGRIANRLDLRGTNFTVDAACAASLAAVSLAVKELTSGASDLVICGGADLHNDIFDFQMFASVHALSPSGQCRTFSEDADGIVLGEAVAAVVLKRLEDAEHDGDHIYAVIKGVGSSSDGRSLGLTAPRREGQVRALERAYEQAGFSPAEVGLVEAHGTGTVVGDRTELETLDDMFVRSGAEHGSCALGSVKSQIGHTKCAAGLAGLMKAALAIERRTLPPTGNITSPNAAWNAERSPFTLNDVPRPWTSSRRIAGVSAFGFGGTNFHVTLASPESGTTPRAGFDVWPCELFVLRAESGEELTGHLDRIEQLLAADQPPRLRDLAKAAWSRGSGQVRAAFVASDLDDLREKLDSVRSGNPVAGVHLSDASADLSHGRSDGQPLVAFLFPGQGSQRAGMLRDIFVAFPQLHPYLELAGDLAATILPPTAWTAEARERQQALITRTESAQPALGVAGLALASLLRELGIEPALAAGHSYGELVALAVAGSVNDEQLMDLSRARAQAILAAIEGRGGDSGTMAAVSGTLESVEAAIEGIDGLVVANHNAPEQVVVSGTTPAVEAALTRFGERGISARRIPVACAFHSPLVADASASFATVLHGVPVNAPRIPVFANASAAPYPADGEAVRHGLAEQLGSRVRFVETVEALYDSGARVFVEVGPGRILTGLTGRILADRPHLAVACDEPGSGGLERFLDALAQLAAAGVSLQADALFTGREIADVSEAAERSATVFMVDGHIATPVSGELPDHALRPIDGQLSVGLPAIAGTAPTAGDREAIVLQYLQSMREMAATQREVLLSYLGAAPAPPQQLPTVDVPQHAAAPAAPAEAPREAEQAAPETETGVDVAELLLEIISERTGYPREMLQLDVDLEADLSIDSIKRVEILGALDERLGRLGGEGVLEELVTAKTLRAILELIDREAQGGSAPATPAPGAAPAAGDGAGQATLRAPDEVARYVLRVSPTAPPPNGGLEPEGLRVSIVRDGVGITGPLAELLTARGATVSLDGPGEGSDAVIDLSLLSPGSEDKAVREVFLRVRDAVLAGTGHVLVATGLGGAFGHGLGGNGSSVPMAGAAGLLKTIARERPGVRVRTVDIDPGRDPSELAELLFTELFASDDAHEVGYDRDTRNVITVTPEARSNGDVQLPLDAESVVLVTGGARGIGARIALSVAERFGCRLELIGRTPRREGPEPYPRAHDEVALRKELAASGLYASPAEIEAACSRIVAERDIDAALALCSEAGSSATYHSVDVRDDEAFSKVIESIYERHGRLDGVIHAAGLIEDRLFTEKSQESFDRVFETKVSAALTLARAVRPDISFIAFFSSVSGVFGNRGQVDYAAANDFLNKLAVVLNQRLEGRVFSVAWGPWGGGGMVSPALAKEFEKRGISMIEPDEGCETFLGELLYGKRDDTQVVLVKADVAALE